MPRENKKREAAKSTTVLSAQKKKRKEEFVPEPYADEPPPAPDYIQEDETAQVYYDYIIKYLTEYKMFNRGDVLLVAQAAFWQSQFDYISNQINARKVRGMDIKMYYGYIQSLQVATTKLNSLYAKLGMSPLSREQMKSYVGKVREDETDPLSSALGEGSSSGSLF